MSDLTDRLRDVAASLEYRLVSTIQIDAARAVLREAADTIEALTAERDEAVLELGNVLAAFSRMPDAGLEDTDPRFDWWNATAKVRERARAFLARIREET